MLSRDQVLHVARLARLELSEDEQRRMSEELTKVLDHIERIGELGDLADVEPTAHVVAVENALRADEPRPSLPSETALLTAAEAAARIRAGDLDPVELWDGYRARAAADGHNAFTWVADGEAPAVAR